VEQRSGEQRPDDVSGDYGYDEAHERSTGVPHEHLVARSVPGPARRPPSDRDGDMSYDEAHDF